MQCLDPKAACLGTPIRTEWSSRLVVVQVLYTVRGPEFIFHGVRVENLNQQLGDWPHNEGLLWVFEDS